MYYARFEPDRKDGGYVITFPDFGWGVDQADSDEQALQRAADLLWSLTDYTIQHEEALPPARIYRGPKHQPVCLPTLQEAKSVLYREWKDSGMKKADLARRMKIQKANVDRLFRLKHDSRFSLIDAAMQALGKRFRLSSEAA